MLPGPPWLPTLAGPTNSIFSGGAFALGVVAALTGAIFWAHQYSWLLLKAAHTSELVF